MIKVKRSEVTLTGDLPMLVAETMMAVHSMLEAINEKCPGKMKDAVCYGFKKTLLALFDGEFDEQLDKSPGFIVKEAGDGAFDEVGEP